MGIGNGNNIIKSVGAIFIVLVAFGSLQRDFTQKMVFNTTVIDKQIESIKDEIERINNRLIDDRKKDLTDAECMTKTSEAIVAVDIKLANIKSEILNINADLESIENWRTWWYTNAIEINATQSAQIKSLEREIFESKEE